MGRTNYEGRSWPTNRRPICPLLPGSSAGEMDALSDDMAVLLAMVQTISGLVSEIRTTTRR
jgi:hypothetical protein